MAMPGLVLQKIPQGLGGDISPEGMYNGAYSNSGSSDISSAGKYRADGSNGSNGNHSASNGGESSNGDDGASCSSNTNSTGSSVYIMEAKPAHQGAFGCAGLSEEKVYALTSPPQSAAMGQPMFIDQTCLTCGSERGDADWRDSSKDAPTKSKLQTHMLLAYDNADAALDASRRKTPASDGKFYDRRGSFGKIQPLQNAEQLELFSAMQDQSALPFGYQPLSRGANAGGISLVAPRCPGDGYKDQPMENYAHLAQNIATLSQQLTAIERQVQTQIARGQEQIMQSLAGGFPTATSALGAEDAAKQVAALNCVAAALRDLMAQSQDYKGYAPGGSPMLDMTTPDFGSDVHHKMAQQRSRSDRMVMPIDTGQLARQTGCSQSVDSDGNLWRSMRL